MYETVFVNKSQPKTSLLKAVLMVWEKTSRPMVHLIKFKLKIQKLCVKIWVKLAKYCAATEYKYFFEGVAHGLTTVTNSVKRMLPSGYDEIKV